MFSCRISPISLHLSLFLSSFVNCYVYMIVRSSLKNNYLYEIHCIYSSLFSCLGYSTNIQVPDKSNFLRKIDFHI